MIQQKRESQEEGHMHANRKVHFMILWLLSIDSTHFIPTMRLSLLWIKVMRIPRPDRQKAGSVWWSHLFVLKTIIVYSVVPILSIVGEWLCHWQICWTEETRIITVHHLIWWFCSLEQQKLVQSFSILFCHFKARAKQGQISFLSFPKTWWKNEILVISSHSHSKSWEFTFPVLGKNSIYDNPLQITASLDITVLYILSEDS